MKILSSVMVEFLGNQVDCLRDAALLCELLLNAKAITTAQAYMMLKQASGTDHWTYPELSIYFDGKQYVIGNFNKPAYTIVLPPTERAADKEDKQ